MSPSIFPVPLMGVPEPTVPVEDLLYWVASDNTIEMGIDGPFTLDELTTHLRNKIGSDEPCRVAIFQGLRHHISTGPLKYLLLQITNPPNVVKVPLFDQASEIVPDLSGVLNAGSESTSVKAQQKTTSNEDEFE